MKNINIELKGKKILITGAAGFIGANLVLELLRTVSNINIIGIDNLNDYYDVSIKEYRLKQIEEKMKEILGHSTDYLDMLIMAMIFRIKPTPKRPKAKIGKI